MMRPVVGSPIPFQVGVPEVAPKALEVYPNPATHTLFIRWPETVMEGTLRMYDMQGRIHYQAGGRTDNIDMSDMPAGIYLVHLVGKDGNIRYSTKVVKTRN